MEDGDPVGHLSGSEERNVEKLVISQAGDLVSDGSLKEDRRWDAEADHPIEEVKELGKSKWSNNLDEDDVQKNGDKRNLNSLSGLGKSYSKEGKSVRWGDQVCLSMQCFVLLLFILQILITENCKSSLSLSL